MKTIFINPFEKYADWTLLLIGILAAMLGSAAGFYFNARFDGVLDLHFVEKVSAFSPLLDISISIAASAVIFFIVGKYYNPKTRLIDIFNTCLIAKIPFYILTVFNTNNWIYNATTQLMSGVQKSIVQIPDPSKLLPILIFSLFTFPALVLVVVLLYNGFKVATNAKGMKSKWLFVAALLVSEIFSKILLSIYN